MQKFYSIKLNILFGTEVLAYPVRGMWMSADQSALQLPPVDLSIPASKTLQGHLMQSLLRWETPSTDNKGSDE